MEGFDKYLDTLEIEFLLASALEDTQRIDFASDSNISLVRGLNVAKSEILREKLNSCLEKYPTEIKFVLAGRFLDVLSKIVVEGFITDEEAAYLLSQKSIPVNFKSVILSLIARFDAVSKTKNVNINFCDIDFIQSSIPELKAWVAAFQIQHNGHLGRISTNIFNDLSLDSIRSLLEQERKIPKIPSNLQSILEKLYATYPTEMFFCTLGAILEISCTTEGNGYISSNDSRSLSRIKTAHNNSSVPVKYQYRLEKLILSIIEFPKERAFFERDLDVKLFNEILSLGHYSRKLYRIIYNKSINKGKNNPCYSEFWAKVIEHFPNEISFKKGARIKDEIVSELKILFESENFLQICLARKINGTKGKDIF